MPQPRELLLDWVLAQSGPEAEWVRESLDQIAAQGQAKDLYMFMGLAPRRLGKVDLALSPEDIAAADTARLGWRPKGWSLDGAARILALLFCPDEPAFSERFKDLRRTADVAELIALYRGLPLYPEPEALHDEVGEGLRSNINAVFEAIAHDNPFPRDHFDTHRWNHMILKALFIGSALGPIPGLRARANPELARIMVDFAQERRAAARPVPGDLAICLEPFVDDAGVAAELARITAVARVTEEVST